MYATLCCDGSVSFADGKEVHIGDPTETAIVYASYMKGMTKAALDGERLIACDYEIKKGGKSYEDVEKIDEKN